MAFALLLYMMSKSYKAPNKRIIHRSGNGKFRKSNLSDIGGACCKKCNKLYVIDTEYARVGNFIDPFRLAEAKEYCKECRPMRRID